MKSPISRREHLLGLGLLMSTLGGCGGASSVGDAVARGGDHPSSGGASSPLGRAVQAWAEHRAALLFRRGNFPSGLPAAEWLKLAESFEQLKELLLTGQRSGHSAKAMTTAINDSLTILSVFRTDDPVLRVFLGNTLRRTFRRR
jgi:hypothetical protein